MAPQTSIPVAASVLGLIGTICWCIQLCPQIWKSWRSKSTEGLPSAMMLTWGISGLPFGIYAITQNFNIPLQVQPQCFCLFCLVSWAQVQYYSNKWPARRAFLAVSALLATVLSLEVLFVFLLRDRYAQGVRWATELLTAIGIVACAMIVAGYLPIPGELIKRRGRIVGISLLFLAIDWLGAFFSLMSLAAQNTFDLTFGILYGLVVTIEACMFLSHGIWLLRTRGLRRRARDAGVAFDDFPEAVEWQEQGYDVTFERLWRNLRRPAGKSTDSDDASDTPS